MLGRDWTFSKIKFSSLIRIQTRKPRCFSMKPLLDPFRDGLLSYLKASVCYLSAEKCSYLSR